jgi:hypothetical protein
LNVSGDYAYSVTEPTSRTSLPAGHGKTALFKTGSANGQKPTLRSISLLEKIPARKIRMILGHRPPPEQPIRISLNTNGTVNIDKGWLNNIRYTISGNYTTSTPTRKNFSKCICRIFHVGNRRSGVEQQERPEGLRCNREGTDQHSANEMDKIATYLPNEYFSRYDIYGEEVNIFCQGECHVVEKSGRHYQQIVIGADLKPTATWRRESI